MKSIIMVKQSLNLRQKSKAFFTWAAMRPLKETKKPEFSSESFVRSSGNFKEFVRDQGFAELSVNHGKRPSVPMMKRSASNSYIEKDEKSALFDRLYEDAARKKYLLEKVQSEEKNKGMEECTFRPEITEYNQKKPPVFERLNYSDVKEKEEFYKKQKETRELEGCTFHPKTNSTKSLSIDVPFDKLYKDAEIQRQKLRAKEVVEKNKELVDCTFRPTILNPSPVPSGSVYEKLYNSYQENQREKRRLELERQTKEEEQFNFIPKLLTPKRETDSTPVYARLYAEVEKRKEKLKKKIDEKERSSSASRSVKKSDEPPRFEVLYSLHKEAQEKKNQLQEKYFKESGVCFKPDTTKTSTPKRLRNYSPKTNYPVPRKPTDSQSESSNR